MTRGIFVTGTDTGVGKTILSAALLTEARRRGMNAAPMKPIQTGCEDGLAPDLEFCLEMAEMQPADKKAMAPWLFEPACSPHLAAEMAGTPIDLASIGDAFDTLSQSYEMVIAEGAGGVLVPIDRERTMLDLMKMLQLPVVVAARPALGTLNHTLLTLHRLRAEGLKVLAVVLIESEPMEAGFIEEDNRKTLKEMAGAPVLGPIPFMTDLSPTSFGTTTRPVAEELIDQD